MRIRAAIAAAGMLFMLALPAVPAIAQYGTPGNSPSVGETIDSPPQESPRPRTTVKPNIRRRPPLSVTGADVAMIAAFGAGSVGFGAVLVTGSRRRRTK
jgi:hypothetical protein